MELKSFNGLFRNTSEYIEIVQMIKQRKDHSFKYNVEQNVIKVPCLKI